MSGLPAFRFPLISCCAMITWSALLPLVTSAGYAQATPGQSSRTLSSRAQSASARSPRNANYEIRVRLDPEAKTLTGTQTLSWRNIQDTATHELWFHLYWNGWRNSHSTWLREDRLRGRSDRGSKIREGDWSYLEVDEIRLADGTDLMATRRFSAPDDGNTADRTVIVISLPKPVAPGETVEVELVWRAKIPRTFARTGYRDDFYFMAHWYPAIGVFEGARGWNTHQFHAATEFFADYGVYDVSLELPDDLVVGATGLLQETTDLGDGFTRHRFVQADVHNFTWTASPDYVEITDRFAVDGLPEVAIRLLMQPEHLHQTDRHLHATKAALEHYGRWYGAYPYEQITVIDPAYGSGAGGMEYPTIFTCGTRVINPAGGGSPEGVTVHEAGHQFWYGVVGNNEIEHAWLDEGLNTFSTARTMDVTYGPSKMMRSYLRPPGGEIGGLVRKRYDDFEQSRAVYGSRFSRFIGSDGPTMDAMSVPTYEAFPRGAGTLSYHKTAMWLHTLERHLGWEVLQPAMAAYYQRFAFGHPEPDDFFAVLEEISGRDLDPFFDQVYRQSKQFDYALASVSTKPAKLRGYSEGTDGEPVIVGKDASDKDAAEKDAADAEAKDGSARQDEVGEGGEDEIFRTEVVVRRLGGGVFPVDVLMVFDDGTEVRRAWDGRARWKLFVEERAAKLEYAVVDPERVLLLDLDYTNNSRLVKSASRFAARKWSSKWMVWLQDLMTTFTFYL